MTGLRGHHEHDRRWLILWHALALPLVVVGPTMARLGLPFWELSERLFPQVPVLAVGYALTALLLTLPASGSPRPGLMRIAVTGAACYGLPVLFLLEPAGFPYSRVVLAISGTVGLALAAAPHFLAERGFRVSLGALALASTAVLSWAALPPVGVAQGEAAQSRDRSSMVRGTALHNVRITYHRELVGPSDPTGGGLDRYGDGFLVVNGAGEFHRLTWAGASLRSEELDLPPLLNRESFLADYPPEIEARHFRTMDLLVDTVSSAERILVSHYVWDPGERCVAMRVSAIGIRGAADLAFDADWETLFTARPCLPFDGSSPLTNLAGGRMTWLTDGRLLLTLGDMGHSGFEGRGTLAQEIDADYGKIITLDRQGLIEVVSMGHRNPEGLVQTRTGTIWSTEHGPRGGDELNLIVEDGNYGWPSVTYGTAYRSTSWSPPDGLLDTGPYEEPAYTWLPSVGISQLLEVGAQEFPAWEGDLLVGSLTGASLSRVRVRLGRVVYAERILIGRRIRDLVEDGNGTILIWTDQSDLVSLTNAGIEVTGEVLYSECAVCHEGTDEAPAIAPDLEGVFGRRAGSLPDYAYSEALRNLNLEWTEDALGRFLADPPGFAPGTTMIAPEMSEASRDLVIEFLRTYD